MEGFPIEEAEEEILQSCKIFLVGSTQCGKTSILKASCPSDNFSTYCEQTPGVDYRIIRSQSEDNGKWIKLHCWEAGGNRRFRDIIKSYFKDVRYFAYVFDLSNRNSFEELNEWLQITGWNPDGSIMGVLVGNKSDLTREVTEDEALKFKETYGLNNYIEVSAKKGTNLMELFKFFANARSEEKTTGEEFVPLLQQSQMGKKCTCCCLIL